MTATRTAGRYNPDDPALRYGMSVRHAALGAAASDIRIRRGRVPVEQILLLVAAVLFPLGLAFVMLGWWGAAHTGHLYAQIDYLISGGLLGLGISVAGGFMYFGYWLSRQLNESRRQNALTLQSLQRIEDLLDESLSGHGAGPAVANGYRNGFASPAPRSDAPAPAERAGQADGADGERRPAPRRAAGRSRESQAAPGRAAEGPPAEDAGGAEDPTREVPAVGEGPMLLATPRGSLLHRPDCPVVARRSDLRSVPAGTEGFRYCTMCDAAGVVR